MKSFVMSIVATSLCSSTSMMHVSRTELVVSVGELSSSLDIKSLFFLPPPTVLTFRVTSLFYYGNIG